MSVLDIEAMLAPLSEEAPCGPNLEYDPLFADLESAARGKREQQYGDTIIPAEAPNWPEVRRLGIELLSRTKDLRVACLLARALLTTDGLPGIAEGLALVRGYVERYWPTVHPQLDSEDDYDPTLRVNTISSLSDQATMVHALRHAPMVSAPLAGRYSLRDLAVATGEVEAPGEDAPTKSTIEAAFLECALADLIADTESVRASEEHTAAIESAVTQQVGATQAVSLAGLHDTLRELQIVLENHLAQRQASSSEEAPGEGSVSGDGESPVVRGTGEITSRADVVRALERICEYYERYEPSSPLPLLLGRAKRLATKSFLDIMQDLSPDSVAQIRALGGTDQEESES
jgi:type VI secretion system protein ImpA